MKSPIRKLLALLLILALLGAAGFAEEADAALTAEPWVSEAGTTLNLSGDGSAQITNPTMSVEGRWSYASPVLRIDYELYGTHALEYRLEQRDGGWRLIDAEGNPFMKESEYEAAQSETDAGARDRALSLGEEITLPFLKFTLENAELVGTIGGDRGWYSSPEGTHFFRLKGTVENLYDGELDFSRVRSQFTFNGEYTFNGGARIYSAAGLSGRLAPGDSAELSIFADISDAMAEGMVSAGAAFSFNENLATEPGFVGEGDYIFRIDLDSETLAAAKRGPVLERVTFEECPALPTPLSFSEARVTGNSKSSADGRVTGVSYTFAPMRQTDSVKNLQDLYLESLRGEGFSVVESGSGYTVSDGEGKLATVSLAGGSVKVQIYLGDAGDGGTSAADGAVPGAEPGGLKLGDTITANTASLTLKEIGTADKLYSCIAEEPGYYHYYQSRVDPFYYVLCDFENTGAKSVDIVNIYAAFVIDGEYSCRADFAGVQAGAKQFIRNVAPQSGASCYVFAEIPGSVLQNARSIVLKVGFTDGFDYRVAARGGMPDFSYADQVFEVALPLPAVAGESPARIYTDGATVQKVQQALNDAGFDCGTPDGVAGARTKRAIQDYQAAAGMEQTGAIDDDLLAAMGLS